MQCRNLVGVKHRARAVAQWAIDANEGTACVGLLRTNERNAGGSLSIRNYRTIPQAPMPLDTLEGLEGLIGSGVGPSAGTAPVNSLCKLWQPERLQNCDVG